MSERNTGLDLLRVLSILSIIAGHFYGQGLVPAGVSGFNAAFSGALGCFGRVACNVFVIISAWHLSSMRFSPMRVVDLYVRVALVCVPLTLLSVVVSAPSARDVSQGLVPFYGRPLWFVSAYLSLLAASPALNAIVVLPRRVITTMACAVVLCVCLPASVPSWTPPEYTSDLLWFAALYVLVGSARRLGWDRAIPSGASAAAAGMTVPVVLFAAQHVPCLSRVATHWLVQLPGLPCLVSSVLLFGAFRSIGVRLPRVVGTVAGCTLTAYVLHQTPAFRQVLWGSVMRADLLCGMSPAAFASAFVADVAGLLAISSVLDRIYVRPALQAVRGTRVYSRAVTLVESAFSPL